MESLDTEEDEETMPRQFSSSIPMRKSFVDREAYWSAFDEEKRKYFHFFEVIDSVMGGAMMKVKVGVAGETPSQDSFPMFRSSKQWLMIYWNLHVPQDRWSLVLSDRELDVEDSTLLSQQQINDSARVVPLQEVSEVYLDPKAVTSFRFYRGREATQCAPTSPMVLASSWADAIYCVLQLQSVSSLPLLREYFEDYRRVVRELIAEEERENDGVALTREPSQHLSAVSAERERERELHEEAFASPAEETPRERERERESAAPVLGSRKKSKRVSILDTMRNAFFATPESSPRATQHAHHTTPSHNAHLASSSGAERESDSPRFLKSRSSTADERERGESRTRPSLLGFSSLGVLPSERGMGVKLAIDEEREGERVMWRDEDQEEGERQRQRDRESDNSDDEERETERVSRAPFASHSLSERESERGRSRSGSASDGFLSQSLLSSNARERAREKERESHARARSVSLSPHPQSSAKSVHWREREREDEENENKKENEMNIEKEGERRREKERVVFREREPSRERKTERERHAGEELFEREMERLRSRREQRERERETHTHSATTQRLVTTWRSESGVGKREKERERLRDREREKERERERERALRRERERERGAALASPAQELGRETVLDTLFRLERERDTQRDRERDRDAERVDELEALRAKDAVQREMRRIAAERESDSERATEREEETERDAVETVRERLRVSNAMMRKLLRDNDQRAKERNRQRVGQRERAREAHFSPRHKQDTPLNAHSQGSHSNSTYTHNSHTQSPHTDSNSPLTHPHSPHSPHKRDKDVKSILKNNSSRSETAKAHTTHSHKDHRVLSAPHNASQSHAAHASSVERERERESALLAFFTGHGAAPLPSAEHSQREREREWERETERRRARQRETERQRVRAAKTVDALHRPQRERESERVRPTEGERDTERDRDGERDSEKETEKERESVQVDKKMTLTELSASLSRSASLSHNAVSPPQRAPRSLAPILAQRSLSSSSSSSHSVSSEHSHSALNSLTVHTDHTHNTQALQHLWDHDDTHSVRSEDENERDRKRRQEIERLCLRERVREEVQTLLEEEREGEERSTIYSGTQRTNTRERELYHEHTACSHNAHEREPNRDHTARSHNAHNTHESESHMSEHKSSHSSVSQHTEPVVLRKNVDVLYNEEYRVTLSLLSQQCLRDKLLSCKYCERETESTGSVCDDFVYVTSRVGVQYNASVLLENIPQARQFAILTLSAIVAELLDSDYYVQFDYFDEKRNTHEFVFVPVKGVVSIDIDGSGNGLFRLSMDVSGAHSPILHTKHIFGHSVFDAFTQSSSIYSSSTHKSLDIAECVLQLVDNSESEIAALRVWLREIARLHCVAAQCD